MMDMPAHKQLFAVFGFLSVADMETFKMTGNVDLCARSLMTFEDDAHSYDIDTDDCKKTFEDIFEDDDGEVKFECFLVYRLEPSQMQLITQNIKVCGV
jgi:hypothetical protein